ncbi:nocturnin-like isoform X2 [Palaemon carinicauda]|uniref:nocturnin-like isoform X2 n=1 Tax=Palaemon carinicauda TaxID=392227 RepID=UPI0035B68BE4
MISTTVGCRLVQPMQKQGLNKLQRHLLGFCRTVMAQGSGMGSFTSKPRVESEENQDDHVVVPKDLDARALLEWVREPIKHLPAILPRNYRKAPTYGEIDSPSISAGGTFRVMQWNILAQALGTHADNFVMCPAKALEWNTRRYRILEEIVTHMPHIICLQEVDHFDVIERVLASQGYKGVFMPKPESPCLFLPNNNGPDGCAVFWDDSKFKLIRKETRVVEVWHVQSNQVAILLIFEERSTEKEIAVLTTHLKARQGALLSSLRNEQGKDLLGFLEQHCSSHPTIVCGDFNADPSEPVYATMMDESTGLDSAYTVLNGGEEPPYSTWKIRESGEHCHNIDYIFYTPRNLCVEGGFDAPTEEDLGPCRAPSFAYPSDHFSLICDFSLQPERHVVLERDNNSTVSDGESNLPGVLENHESNTGICNSKQLS